MSDVNSIFSIPDSAVELAKDVYEDVAKPAASQVGKTMGLIPRTINNSFAWLVKWNLKKEYEVKEYEQMLENKLHNKTDEEFTEPHPYVFVPAILAVSYSMGNDELRNLYANLLANAFLKDKSDQVHPAFVEIIKQMSPLDAQMFKALHENANVINAPIIDLQSHDTEGIGLWNIETNITGFSFSDHASQAASVDNLCRLGIIAMNDNRFINEKCYDQILTSEEYAQCYKTIEEMHKYISEKREIRPKKKIVEITEFGCSFYAMCVRDVDE